MRDCSLTSDSSEELLQEVVGKTDICDFGEGEFLSAIKYIFYFSAGHKELISS